jgi:hypothetical protein
MSVALARSSAVPVEGMRKTIQRLRGRMAIGSVNRTLPAPVGNDSPGRLLLEGEKRELHRVGHIVRGVCPLGDRIHVSQTGRSRRRSGRKQLRMARLFATDRLDCLRVEALAVPRPKRARLSSCT